MTEAEFRREVWPTILTVKDLIRVLRLGYDLVMLPLPESAAASAEPAYVLRKDGRQSPAGQVSARVVRAALFGPKAPLGHGMKLPDGGFLYKLTTRAE